MPWLLVVIVIILALAALIVLARSRAARQQPALETGTSGRQLEHASPPLALQSADRSAASARGQEPTASARAPSADDDVPVSYGDDEEDDHQDLDFTLVGNLPPEIRDLMRGYRDVRPEDLADENDATIEMGDEVIIDQILVDELLNDEPTGANALIVLQCAGVTDVGHRRKANEDTLLMMPDESIFVVADGMGGHAAGDVASNLAVEVIETAFRTNTFGGPPNILWPRRADELARSIEMANQAISERAANDQALFGMGTTIVAIRFAPTKRKAYIAHVGDSRCYRLRDGALTQLMRDHTLANLMGATGKLGNQLSQAVGLRQEVKVDLNIDRPLPHDRYLLCSDGLTKMVTDEQIRDMLARDDDPQTIATALVEAAKARGGLDNITVIVVEIFAPLLAKKPSRPSS